MGSISRSWDLLGQSFTVLKSDKELMWLPILSAMFCLTAAVIILGIGLIWVLPPGVPIPKDPVAQKELSKQMAPFIFLFYIATYSVSSYFNVALVSIASNRLDGGNATLNDGLQIAWMRKWSIFQWALFAATIGMLIQMFDRRAGVFGRMFTRFAGVAWSIASFFVIPVLAAENISPVDALFKSGQIVRKRWGEQIAGGLSFGIIFVLLALLGIALPIMGARLGQREMIAGMAAMVVYWILLGIVNSAAQGIFVAALYRYATGQKVTGVYHVDDLSAAWQPKES